MKKIRSRLSCGSGNSMYGRHHSEETKEKMRQKALGRHHSLETRLKISKANKGKTYSNRKPLSLETRLKISKANKGKHLTEEHKMKLSESRRRYAALLQYDL